MLTGAAGAEVVDDSCCFAELAGGVGPDIRTVGFLRAWCEHLHRCTGTQSGVVRRHRLHFGPRGNGIIWLSCWIFARAGWWVRHCRKAGRLVGYQGTGYGLRATWKVSGPTVSLRSRVAVRESFISPAAVALSNAPEHELPGKLLGQCADGARVPQLENRMDTDSGLQNGPKNPMRYQPFLDASVQLDSTPSIHRWAGASSGRRKT